MVKKCYKCKVSKSPSYNLPEETKGIWCKKCAPVNAVNVRAKKCYKCNVSKNPSFNLPNLPKETKGIWCGKCAPVNAVNVRSKKCTTCKLTIPIYNLPNEKKGKWCFKCKPDNAIDVINKICIKCKKIRACFNIKEETTGKWCNECKPDNAINVVDKRCQCKDTVNPLYNYPNETVGIWCSKCKPDNTIDVVTKPCIVCKKVKPGYYLPGNSKTRIWCVECKPDNAINGNYCPCNTRVPIFNYPGQTGGIWCSVCPERPKETVNVISKKCPCGISISLIYNYPGQTTGIWCSKCPDRPLDTINVISRRCLCELSTAPRFNYPGQTTGIWCSKCPNIPENVVNVMDKLCKTPLCQTQVKKKYEGYCLRCYVHNNPDKTVSRNYKIKEKHIVDAVIIHLEQKLQDKMPINIIKDKRIIGGCSSKRPDIMFNCLTHWICCENDENEHKNYDNLCENSRTMSLYEDMGKIPMILIRFNCDKFTKDLVKNESLFKTGPSGLLVIRKQKEFDKRTMYFAECIAKYIASEPPEKAITTEYLFYSS